MYDYSVFLFPEELGYLVDAIINSGEISTFPGQQVMINHKITIKILIKSMIKKKTSCYGIFRFTCQGIVLWRCTTKTITIIMRRKLTNTQTKIFTSFAFKGRRQPQSGRQDTSLATPSSSKSFISSEHFTHVEFLNPHIKKKISSIIPFSFISSRKVCFKRVFNLNTASDLWKM